MRIAMLGTGVFAEPTFRELLASGLQVVGLVTQPDRGGTQKRGSTRMSGVGMAALAGALPVLQPESINTPDGVAMLQTLQPDLLVVAAYGQILRPAVLAVPRFGAINVHASLLPKYRGASPIAHAILNGETTTGVTIIRIALGLDSGDMLARESVEIGPDETTGELEARLAPLGARLGLDVVRRLHGGPVVGLPQDAALVSKAPKFTKDHGQIAWAKPAAQVRNQIRAMQPWPTAYTALLRPGKEPTRLAVLRVRPSDMALSPGELHGTKDGLTVGCSPGSLDVLELQPAGKKRMTIAEFLRGTPVPAGSRFTSP